MTATAGGTRPRTGPVAPRRRRRPGLVLAGAGASPWSRRCWPASGWAPSRCRRAPSSSPCSTGAAPPACDLSGGLSATQEAVLLQLRLPRVRPRRPGRRRAGHLRRRPTRASSATRWPTRTCSARRPAPGWARRWSSPTRRPQTLGPFGIVPLAAFVGALVGVGCALALGTAAGGSHSATLLLAGVAVAAFLAAGADPRPAAEHRRPARGLRLAARPARPRAVVRRRAGAALPRPVVPRAAVLRPRRWTCSPSGTTRPARWACTPAGCGCWSSSPPRWPPPSAVAVSGLIGFVGLVVPHIARRFVGGSQRPRAAASRC